MVADTRAYYQAGLALLRHVEAKKPTNRRFGPEADALWSQFQGELNSADRIDLLLRDADAQWPGSFGAQSVFDSRGVAEDEAFGAEWPGLDGIVAAELWRSADAVAPSEPHSALTTIASCWGIELADFAVETVGAAEQLVVVGPSAIAALIAKFIGQEALDWADQVVVVATRPAHRQLALAGGALLGSTKAVRVVSVTSPSLASVKAQLKGKSPRLLASADATSEDAALAKELSGAS